MRTLQIEKLGRPLVEAERPDPEPGTGELTVRIDAAGICRSDVHYRSGSRAVPGLPLVPGHEVAGTIIAAGAGTEMSSGTRVCAHYLVTCGVCGRCRGGAEQFCEGVEMIGLDRQGGYAEAIVLPERNLFEIPDGMPIEVAAVMMCSTATAFHALHRGRIQPGDRVAVLGAGGLGASAVRLAQVMGASEVLAVDVNPVKLEAAEAAGAVPVDGNGQVVDALRAGGGVDVALELVGIADLMRVAVASLAPGGRAVAVGITDDEFGLDPFRDLVLKEGEIIGAADHLSSEIAALLAMVGRGDLDLSGIVTGSVRLDADAVNGALDALESFGDEIRVVISRDPA